jgi:hypothetical protein
MMRIFTVLFLSVFLFSCRVEAPISATTDLFACKPEVIQAMKDAWYRAGAGSTGAEAGLRVDMHVIQYRIGRNKVGYKVEYIVVPHEYTNEQDQLTVEINIWTVAEFHVHPNNSGPAPSTPENNSLNSTEHGDTLVADQNMIDIYTFSTQGLYVYRWQTKKTFLLRERLDWTLPCVATPAKKK